MKIWVRINGEPRALPAPMTLRELVEQTAGVDDAGIAVGLNRQVVPRSSWDSVRVDEGDSVEIIAPFAGG